MRLRSSLDPLRRFLLAGVPMGIALVALSLHTFGSGAHAWAAILLYALLCELYIFAFTLVLSSVSVRVLLMLRHGPIATSALTTAYQPRGMVDLRVERLLKQRLIGRDGGRLVVTPAGARVLSALGTLRRFFRHEAG